MEVITIKQPAGIGDIFYCLKIAKRLLQDNKTKKVIWPVSPVYSYIKDYIKFPNLEFVSSKNLLKTLNAYLKTFELLEANRTIERLNSKGEDQLGIKGLMPPIGGTINQSVELENKKGSGLRKFELDFEFTGEHLNAYEWIMHMADASNTILDISNKSNIDFYKIYEAASMFHDKNLIKVIG